MRRLSVLVFACLVSARGTAPAAAQASKDATAYLDNTRTQHILRMPADPWPDGVNRAFKRLNEKVYVPMQGPSEMGASGKLVNWIGRRTSGRYLSCPNGSHMAMYDDQKKYFDGVVRFVKDVDQGRF